MDLSSVSPESVTASQLALTRETVGVMVMRKVLDIEAAQGTALVQVMSQSAGLGRTIDISA
jgi:hypothetical protein